mgnify:CR=1 FL=1
MNGNGAPDTTEASKPVALAPVFSAALDAEVLSWAAIGVNVPRQRVEQLLLADTSGPKNLVRRTDFPTVLVAPEAARLFVRIHVCNLVAAHIEKAGAMKSGAAWRLLATASFQLAGSLLLVCGFVARGLSVPEMIWANPTTGEVQCFDRARVMRAS